MPTAIPPQACLLVYDLVARYNEAHKDNPWTYASFEENTVYVRDERGNVVALRYDPKSSYTSGKNED